MLLSFLHEYQNFIEGVENIQIIMSAKHEL